jgi:PKD repeat protein
MVPVAVSTAVLVPNIIANPDHGLEPLSVEFRGSATGGSPPYSYSWTFGDGGVSTEQNPTYIYNSYGNYLATLAVSDSRPISASTTHPISVFVVNCPSTTGLIAGLPVSHEGTSPFTVHFSVDGLGPSSNGPFRFQWDFGDGGQSTEQAPTHTYYYTAGNPDWRIYTVTLHIFDKCNLERVTSESVYVLPPPTASTAFIRLYRSGGAVEYQTNHPYFAGDLAFKDGGIGSPWPNECGMTGDFIYLSPLFVPASFWPKDPGHDDGVYVDGSVTSVEIRFSAGPGNNGTSGTGGWVGMSGCTEPGSEWGSHWCDSFIRTITSAGGCLTTGGYRTPTVTIIGLGVSDKAAFADVTYTFNGWTTTAAVRSGSVTVR